MVSEVELNSIYCIGLSASLDANSAKLLTAIGNIQASLEQMEAKLGLQRK
jgi:hypothetical protein